MNRSIAKKAAIGAVIIVVTILHLTTPVEAIVLHEIYQRLYYVPILAAALLFGLRGGISAALFASVAYLPHVGLHWHHTDYEYAINQYAEIVLFHVVGGSVGILGDRTRNARLRAEHTASELQRAYSDLRRTFEQLVQADRLTSLGELAASVVHEVRNPLASIKGAVDIIEEELAPESPRREFADIARREIDRLDHLVADFLKFARPAKPHIAPADVRALVQSVVSLTAQQAAKRSIAVEIQDIESLPEIDLDAEQIKQVLLNLLINAFHAMPEGGTATIRMLASDDTIRIEVCDEGEGIAPLDLPRVFDPFFTTKDDGLGLGLAIAYRIVEQHGGTLNASNGERGAVFRLTLPLAIEVQAPPIVNAS